MSQTPLNPQGGDAQIVAARVPESLRQALFAAAERRGVTPSVLLRQSIERLVSDELDAMTAELGDREPGDDP
ncbi:MAG TPA: hypothetical protein VME19_17785 [Streptosporangiaceae bacterium]|nr:hypothetical protein [Streptosporangiaceae bacterium]